MLSLCDLFFSYKKIFPGPGNFTLKVEEKKMLGIIFMQREHREPLRVQPTNCRPLRKAVLVTASQPAAGRESVLFFQFTGTDFVNQPVHQGPALCAR